MIKIIALIRRRADMSPEEFRDYYERRHVPLFHRTLPADVADAIRHYVQNHAVRHGDGRTEPPYDCVTEIGFDDLAGKQRWSDWYLSEAGKVLRDDEENFMNLRQRVVILTDERDFVR
jgi:uncharacterized protein (TIGR02118 family)